MANIDAPFGFNPVDTIGGAHPGKLGEYSMGNDVIFQGDLVKFASGLLVQSTAGDTNVGVFWGAQYDDATGKPIFSNQQPASTTGKVFVYDNPYQVFEVQGDGASAVGDIGQTADQVQGQGSTATGVSIYELDSSDIGTGANLTIIGFGKDPERSEVGSDNIVYRVLIKEHSYAN
tara:strand:- start:37 stop:561 length:525 start_codon:yes stop_codon:yes gene_type:complete